MDIFDADFGGNGLYGGKVVAGDDLDGNVVTIEIVDDFGSVTAKFVFQ